MRSEPFKGRVRIAANSSLRKLQRAMRRGTMPAERQVVINLAAERAKARSDAYLNSSPAKWAYRTAQSAKKLAAKLKARETRAAAKAALAES